MTCNSKKAIAVRLRYETSPGITPVIGVLVPDRRLLALPVRWTPHFFWDCQSWTVDRQAADYYRKGYDIMHFHVTRTNPPLVYRIAAATFFSGGHSSHECSDSGQGHPEKWHCPKDLFQFDPALEKQSTELQPALL